MIWYPIPYSKHIHYHSRPVHLHPLFLFWKPGSVCDKLWEKARLRLLFLNNNYLVFAPSFFFISILWTWFLQVPEPKKIQPVLCLHSSLTRRFILVLYFVHLVLNRSSTYMVFYWHGCFSKVSKNRVSRGPPPQSLEGPL